MFVALISRTYTSASSLGSRLVICHQGVVFCSIALWRSVSCITRSLSAFGLGRIAPSPCRLRSEVSASNSSVWWRRQLREIEGSSSGCGGGFGCPGVTMRRPDASNKNRAGALSSLKKRSRKDDHDRERCRENRSRRSSAASGGISTEKEGERVWRGETDCVRPWAGAGSERLQDCRLKWESVAKQARPTSSRRAAGVRGPVRQRSD